MRLSPANAADEAGSIVPTASGKIQGVKNNGVEIFRGVPYAASTAGSSRFARAKPVEPWTGVKQTVQFGPVAPQAGHGQPGGGGFARAVGCLVLRATGCGLRQLTRRAGH